MTAVNAAVTGIVLSDARLPDNPLVFVNDEFCRMSGYSRDEVVGRNCRFLQGPDSDRETVGLLRKAIQEERPVVVRLVNYSKDGRLFHNELHMSPVLGASGKADYFVGVQHDVTAQVEAETRVRELSLRLARANEALQSFADTAAREILASLRHVIMFSDALLNGPAEAASPADPSALRTIHDSATRAKRLLVELLEYCSVLSAPLESRQVALRSIMPIREFAGRGVTFEEAGLDELVTCDPALVRRALGEIIDNAAKFVPPGQAPSVEVRARRSGPGELYLEVADRGIGIDAAQARRVLEPFVRLNASAKYDGIGLGLALAGRIAERHNGRVELLPREGGGVLARLHIADAARHGAQSREAA